MSKLILLALTTITCFFTVKDHCSKQINDHLRLEFYSKERVLLYTMTEKELVCFDWEHQSLLVSEDAKNILIKEPKLLSGFMVVKLAGEKLYEVSIISDYMTYEFGNPKLIFEDTGLFFFYENWFFIRYLKSKSEIQEGRLPYFEELLNEQLFNYLKKKGKLNCKNWQVVESTSDVKNEVDLEPQKTAQRVLKKE
ncbi:MAG: hypothetical protein MI974_32525 [Chitinophagales bacterium]|nr:hypothetical protein [Chitinophagales bacterium]